MLISILSQSEGGKRLLTNRTVDVADICPLIRKVVSDVPTPPILKTKEQPKIYKSPCLKLLFDPQYSRGFACHISGVVNEYAGCIALDTGSWYSIVSLKTWTKCLNGTLEDLLPGNLVLETANSGELKSYGFGTVKVKLLDRPYEYIWQVAVVNAHRPEYDLLLGVDFLHHYGAIISLNQMAVDFPVGHEAKRKEDIPAPVPEGARPVVAECTTELRPGTGTVIKCSMDPRGWNHRDCEFEPSSTWGRDIMMPSALVDPKNGKFQLCVENYTDSVAYLPRGHILGWITPGTWIGGKILKNMYDPGVSLVNHISAAEGPHWSNSAKGGGRHPTPLTSKWVNRGKRKGRTKNSDTKKSPVGHPEAEAKQAAKGRRAGEGEVDPKATPDSVASNSSLQSSEGLVQEEDTYRDPPRGFGRGAKLKSPLTVGARKQSFGSKPPEHSARGRGSPLSPERHYGVGWRPGGGAHSIKGEPVVVRTLNRSGRNPQSTVIRADDQRRVPLESAIPLFKVSSLGQEAPVGKDRPSYDDDCDSDGEFPGVPEDPPQKWPDDHLTQMLPKQGLTPEQFQKAKELLERCSSAFVGPDNAVGYTDLVRHTIELEQGTKPIHCPPRRMSFTQKDALDEELDKMLKGGKIVKSRSAWASPVVMVMKKDGSIRCCIDYRRLNEKTKRDSYPLPRIDDALDSLGGSKWFSTLDLASGYWQIAMDEEDVAKTAFTTHRGLFHWLVMPFGLCNAPATFERLMEGILGDLQWQKCLVYLDDIIVFGTDFDVAYSNLEEVFQRLIEAKLKLKPKKCFLFRNEVEYLGHLVSSEGIKPCANKVEAVKEWPTPENLKEVRGFLGLASYYRRFIPDFSEMASPLVHLTKKDVRFEWGEAQESGFQALKDALCGDTVLAYPLKTGLFVLDTDASLHAMGAVLSQVQGDEERVIAYASKSFGPSQQRYCTTKRELLAVVHFVTLFRPYLVGQHFVIRTDHASLIWLINFKQTDNMYCNWIMKLEQYDYEIQHRPGEKHGNADALSRKGEPAREIYRHCGRAACADCQVHQKNMTQIQLMNAQEPYICPGSSQPTPVNETQSVSYRVGDQHKNVVAYLVPKGGCYLHGEDRAYEQAAWEELQLYNPNARCEDDRPECVCDRVSEAFTNTRPSLVLQTLIKDTGTRASRRLRGEKPESSGVERATRRPRTTGKEKGTHPPCAETVSEGSEERPKVPKNAEEGPEVLSSRAERAQRRAQDPTNPRYLTDTKDPQVIEIPASEVEKPPLESPKPETLLDNGQVIALVDKLKKETDDCAANLANVESMSNADWADLQQEDTVLCRLLNLMNKYDEKPPENVLRKLNPEVRALCSLWNNLIVWEGVLMHSYCDPRFHEEAVTTEAHRKEFNEEFVPEGTNYFRRLVPEKMRLKLFQIWHGRPECGHLSFSRIYPLLRKRFFWVGMQSDVKKWLSACDSCQRMKSLGRWKTTAPMKTDSVEAPMARLGVDVMGPWPITASGNRFIVIFQDYFSKWIEVFPLKRHDAVAIADLLVREVISRYGAPVRLHSDQGPEFESRLFAEVCKMWNIRKTRTSPYTPWSNGAVERVNQTVKQMVTHYVDSSCNTWDRYLPMLRMAYNFTEHSSTKFTPYMLFFSRATDPRVPLDMVYGEKVGTTRSAPCPIAYVEEQRLGTRRVMDLANRYLREAMSVQVLQHDRIRNVTSPAYLRGEVVLRHYPPSANTKFGPKYTGPYVVAGMQGSHNVVICNGGQPITVHMNCLRRYRSQYQPADGEIAKDKGTAMNHESGRTGRA